jgi:predicted nicotinamide N-methyase
LKEEKVEEAMAKKARTEIRAYGVRVLLSRHPEIRRLKRLNSPAVHGNKLWASSWLLMDYLDRRGMSKGARVMEVGCGWGLAGIYCAKKHGAIVTGIDIDPEVFAFLRLHADINSVQIGSMKKTFVSVTERQLRKVDVVIGSDICFWDTMVDPLKRFIRRALRANVRLVLIADPGRAPFERLGEYFVKTGRGETLSWTARRPRRVRGRLLRIGSI